MTVQVEREGHQVEAVIARASAFPVDDPGERAAFECEHVVGVQVEVNQAACWEPRRRGSRADRLDEVDNSAGSIGVPTERFMLCKAVLTDRQGVDHVVAPRLECWCR